MKHCQIRPICHGICISVSSNGSGSSSFVPSTRSSRKSSSNTAKYQKYEKYEKSSKKSKKEAKNVKQLLKMDTSEADIPKLTLEEREIIVVQNVDDVQAAIMKQSLYGV